MSWFLTLALVLLTWPATMTSDEYEEQTKYWVNTRHDPDLRGGRCADRYAENHAVALGDGTDLYHQNLGPLLRNCDAKAAGEIIARSYGDPQGVLQDWLDSDVHRTVLLRQRWDRIGVGAQATPNGWVVVVTFLDK